MEYVSMSNSGLAAVREATRIWLHKADNATTLAKDIGCSQEMLQRFADGKAELPREIIDRLTPHLWGDTQHLDHDADILRVTNKTAKIPLGTPPDPTNVGSTKWVQQPIRPFEKTDKKYNPKTKTFE
jgi:hypothetical protein